MPDTGQTAYEARFDDEDRRKRLAPEWARLGPIERAMWARVEAASVSAAGRGIDGDDEFAAALRKINLASAMIKATATERVEAAEASLREAVEVIRALVTWWDDEDVLTDDVWHDIEAQAKTARAFLAKLEKTNADPA